MDFLPLADRRRNSVALFFCAESGTVFYCESQMMTLKCSGKQPIEVITTDNYCTPWLTRLTAVCQSILHVLLLWLQETVETEFRFPMFDPAIFFTQELACDSYMRFKRDIERNVLPVLADELLSH
jgi:hypothetical protein